LRLRLFGVFNIFFKNHAYLIRRNFYIRRLKLSIPLSYMNIPWPEESRICQTSPNVKNENTRIAVPQWPNRQISKYPHNFSRNHTILNRFANPAKFSTRSLSSSCPQQTDARASWFAPSFVDHLGLLNLARLCTSEAETCRGRINDRVHVKTRRTLIAGSEAPGERISLNLKPRAITTAELPAIPALAARPGARAGVCWPCCRVVR
jgi:hypothetical protein